MKRHLTRCVLVLWTLLFILTGCTTVLPDNNLSIDAEGTLRVHYIDVGQGDASLIQTPGGKNILIDGGEAECYETVRNYLQQNKVSTLDVIIATHPHSDHIGSLAKIVSAFDVKAVYAPKVAGETRTYRNFLQAVANKGITIDEAKAGVSIPVDPAISITLFSPPENPSYDDLNDYSPIMKVVFNQTSYLFTGDAEKAAENDALAYDGAGLQASVLKVGHHGSYTSTSAAFLAAVRPQYAIISLGAGNSYGFPHDETLQKLSGITVFRTDRNGSICSISDGTSISFKTQTGKGEQPTATTTEESPVPSGNSNTKTKGYIGNRNSKKFHKLNCPGLPKEENRIYFDNRDEALASGYEPCGTCKP